VCLLSSVKPMHFERIYSMFRVLLYTVAVPSVHSVFVVGMYPAYSVIVTSRSFPLGNLCLFFFIWSIMETFHSLRRASYPPRGITTQL